MNYRVILTAYAESDLRGIYQYIAGTLKSPQNASAQLNRLEREILSLSEMPERYRQYDAEPWKSRNLRVLPVDHYVVLYIPDASQRTVAVIRVAYGGRNLNQLLKQTSF